eukprot:TRINITY_DN15139_c0_g1_i2.p1 TRINITY_DN15139_c0_g1~~TRINITY_DN15139_c0_g1_i2.p1  ORF type:complete len:999 (+),score=185.37 TRINITY_DN15139_c0_g1_i2:71-3067(+)
MRRFNALCVAAVSLPVPLCGAQASRLCNGSRLYEVNPADCKTICNLTNCGAMVHCTAPHKDWFYYQGSLYCEMEPSDKCGNDTDCTGGGGSGFDIFRQSLPPTVSPTDAPTTAYPTASPTAFPTALPSPSPSVSPSASPTAAPTREPTAQPSRGPSASPTAAPTTAQPSRGPSGSPTSSPTFSPTAQPSRSPRAPTLSPVAPVTYCQGAAEGAACPGDNWEVTVDVCHGSTCTHVTAAAAVGLLLLPSGGGDGAVNLTTPVDFSELGPLDDAQSAADVCEGLPGVAAPGAGVIIMQDLLHAPLEVSAYSLSHAHTSVPARLVVGWRLEGQLVGSSGWAVLAEVRPNMSESYDLLENATVQSAVGPFHVRSVRLYATHVRGDHAYDCRSPAGAIVAASAAASFCCCIVLAVMGPVCITVCGCGALAARQKAVDPAVDSPWMGSEDAVRAQVLECYEELHRRWQAKRKNVLAEAAEMLVVQGGEPAALLRKHATAEWRARTAAEPQLRVLPSAVVELLRRYSHEAQDTDYICGLPGAPKPFASYKATDPEHPKAARAAWQGYKAKCKQKTGRPSVNPALYSELNRATREAAEGASCAPEAWGRLGRMLKQACLLIASAAYATDPPQPEAPKMAAPSFLHRANTGTHQRWLRLLSLPPEVRRRFAGLKPGMCIAWSVGVASVTHNRKASADFMYGGAGRCVLVRMRAPQEAARALSIGAASLYGGEGELLLALGTMFRVRRVSYARMLSRHLQPTASTPITLKQLGDAIRNPLLVVDVDWLESPVQWCDAARALCEGALREARDVAEQYSSRPAAGTPSLLPAASEAAAAFPGLPLAGSVLCPSPARRSVPLPAPHGRDPPPPGFPSSPRQGKRGNRGRRKGRQGSDTDGRRLRSSSRTRSGTPRRQQGARSATTTSHPRASPTLGGQGSAHGSMPDFAQLPVLRVFDQHIDRDSDQQYLAWTPPAGAPPPAAPPLQRRALTGLVCVTARPRAPPAPPPEL